MAIHQIDTVNGYLHYLQYNEGEIELLFKELLIRVTNFFRDQAAFDTLQKKVLPYITQHLPESRSIRIWVPACSSGEEVYSVAIVLHEYLRTQKQKHTFQVFATDIDENAIDYARTGIYPASIGVDVSEKRLQQYFTKEDEHYQVKKNIREMIVFARHNTIKDPPFSKLDLICCRNLLIYLTTALQRKLMTIFHYALKPSGILFLGASETIGSSSDLFNAFNAKWKFFKPVERALYYNDLPFSGQPSMPAERRMSTRAEKVSSRQPSLGELTRNLLLEMYSPASVVISEEGNILYFHGRTGKYLEPAPGRANLNIFNLARPELRTALRQVFKKIKAGEKEVLLQGLQLKLNGSVLTFNLKMVQIRKPDHMKGLLLVVFEEIETQAAAGAGTKKAERDSEVTGPVAELEDELQTVKEDLQTTVEELEASNEELQSANEELQSTNEELETSREELQSVNEELMTVNAEEQEKIEQLSLATDDMHNLLASTEIIGIYLDLELRIKGFTPAAVRVFKLIGSDLDRPIGDIVNTLQYTGLEDEMRKVLKTLIPMERQVSDDKGYWYLMKILPYRRKDNMISGLVLTLVDITKQKHAEKMLAATEEKHDAFLAQSGEGFILVDYNTGYITDVNAEFQKMTGMHAWELKELHLWEIMPYKASARIQQKFSAGKQMDFAEKSREIILGAENRNIPVNMQCRILAIAGRQYLQCLIATDEE